MLRFIVACLFFFFVSHVQAIEKKETYGIQSNLSSWFLNGNNFAFWYQKYAQRYRVSISSTDMPGYYTEQGLANHTVNSYSFYWDHFRFENNKLWLGGGLEIWEGQLRKEAVQEVKSYINFNVIGTGGYLWNFHNSFYLAPELTLSVNFGEKSHTIENTAFNTQWVYVFANLHLGWYF